MESPLVTRFLEAVLPAKFSERKAVAAETEESSVTIPRGFDAGEQLMRGVVAAAVMTLGTMLMRRHWHASAGGFAHVERRAVAAEHFDRRPFRQHGNLRWCVWGKLGGRVDNLSVHDREHGFDAFDLFLCH